MQPATCNAWGGPSDGPLPSRSAIAPGDRRAYAPDEGLQ